MEIVAPTVLAAGKYVNWGVISISVANLVIILVMVAVFVLALLLPFPQGRDAQRGAGTPDDPGRGGS